MNILIKISTDSELISYEAIALAFTLATFDHVVQLYFYGDSFYILADSTTRAYGMIQSLELYDLPYAWAGFREMTVAFDDKILDNIRYFDGKISDKLDEFDSVLEF
ncbi:hypothetical protein LU293_00405 [Moraxella nasovis]|uniref:hypothetical protein n=1 Tax=Moraxella nasovis TaxID=2904121 RepID=UPI001F611BF0|nr:hypothetical protein [Moraxella nasovis]UNU73413.1 hypothetical protein LU293_00405 [Moraxella nasovis]